MDIAQYGMLIGKGGRALHEVAATLRENFIDELMSEGHQEQASRLQTPLSEGYPQEDFHTLSLIASLPSEIFMESAPDMQPRKYGDGDPRARFILRGARSSHWDVAELYDRK